VHRPRVQQLVFQETLLPGLPAGERGPSPAPDDGRSAAGVYRPAAALASRHQGYALNRSSRRRPMIIFWISEVPSPMRSIGASRYSRSISASFE
jgi:hypothetical protein